MNSKLQLQDIMIGKRKPSSQAKCQVRIEEDIIEIHEESDQIYEVPKITEIIQTKGHRIAQRMFSKYVNAERIKVHYIKPYTITT